MKIEIKSWLSSEVLFSHDCEENTILITLKAAIKIGADLSRADLSGADLSRANLSGANLSRADLSRADLSGADLSRADLSGANLSRANLSGANLSGANLSGANLSRANLSGANLSGANLSGANLYGEKVEDIKQIGNIGSRGGFTICFKLEKSIKINCGCFWGSLEEFESKVSETHGDSKHASDYMAMIEFIKKIWGVE